GHQHFSAGLVDVTLTHHVSVGELLVKHRVTGSVNGDVTHRNSTRTQIVEAVAGPDHDDLGVADLALEPGARFDHRCLLFAQTLIGTVPFCYLVVWLGAAEPATLRPRSSSTRLRRSTFPVGVV